MKVMRRYLQEIHCIREKMINLNISEGNPAGREFYELQNDLNRVWRNLHAWCRRHGKEFPHEYLYYL